MSWWNWVGLVGIVRRIVFHTQPLFPLIVSCHLFVKEVSLLLSNGMLYYVPQTDECFPVHSRSAFPSLLVEPVPWFYEFPLFLWWWLDLICTSISPFLLAHDHLNMRGTKSSRENGHLGWVPFLLYFLYLTLSLASSLRRTLLPVPISAVLSVLEFRESWPYLSVSNKSVFEALPVWSIPCNNVI